MQGLFAVSTPTYRICFCHTLPSFYSYLYCKVYSDSLLLLTDVCMSVCAQVRVHVFISSFAINSYITPIQPYPNKGFFYSLLSTRAPPLAQLRGTNQSIYIYL